MANVRIDMVGFYSNRVSIPSIMDRGADRGRLDRPNASAQRRFLIGRSCAARRTENGP